MDLLRAQAEKHLHLMCNLTEKIHLKYMNYDESSFISYFFVCLFVKMWSYENCATHSF